MPTREQIQNLAAYLREQREKYYSGTNQAITDEEFNNLEEQLYSWNPTDPYFGEVGTPIEKKKENVRTIHHNIIMKSLKKVKTIEQVINWIQTRLGNGIDVIVQPKIDGASLTCKYINGKISYIATRGDGDDGQDVTHLIEYVTDIPKTIPLKNEIEIRGEGYLPRDTPYKKERETKSLRNIAAGIINRTTGKREDAEYIKFIAYDIVGDMYFEQESDKMEFLKAICPNPIEYVRATSIEQMAAIYEEYAMSKRESLNYHIDGLVLKLNNIELQRQWIGVNPHHPDYAVAWKFKPESKETILKEVRWQIGEKGRQTPVAYFEPIILGGRNISRATLHNQRRLEQLQIEIGNVVVVALGGDVIPIIVGNVTKGIGA
jgi:DNA ligase (NAD+)